MHEKPKERHTLASLQALRPTGIEELGDIHRRDIGQRIRYCDISHGRISVCHEDLNGGRPGTDDLPDTPRTSSVPVWLELWGESYGRHHTSAD
ncbi:hypothetical protein [Roseovarius Plymouth podovirus 1]|uniref:Uncharacterized protein n=1 Tax=Roseovarius Plymouth podovirus 1 TaxID=926474 RepID=K4Q4U8_9CAUD|nr:hypothetical protein HYO70_gp49 [Roseovarius Plymouth podovirus 1]CBX87979.1 hypothetical protein [Roseovarius Plymouth podovirus 1]